MVKKVELNLAQKRVIDEIKRISEITKSNTVTLSDWKKHGNISENQIWRNFENGWAEAIEIAGLKPDTSTKKKTDDELWEELLRVCTKLDKVPIRRKFDIFSSFNSSSYTKRWGNWQQVLIKFKEWISLNHPSSKFINLIPEKEKIKKISENKIKNIKDFVWQSKKGIVYGPPIDFRGLRHEPVNEQGVVFLFGKISEEIGFSIEAIRTDYPDCDGKRLVDRNKNLWETVSIEFEYKSSNFLEHGHDPSKCDVIICWIHDWLECPLEVIELKEIIKRLTKKEIK